MPYQNPEKIFTFLENRKHFVKQELFSYATDTQLNHYWFFSDLYNLFGSEYVGEHKNIKSTTHSALKPFELQKSLRGKKKEILQPENIKDFYTKHIIPITNKYQISSGNTILHAKGPDAKLSRFICWLIFKRHPHLIFTQLYFMNPNIEYEDLYEQAYKFSRIYLRKNLAHTGRIIHGITSRKKSNIKMFNHLIHETFFYNISQPELKRIYGIKENIEDPILNYMGSDSLLALQKAFSSAIKRNDARPDMRFSTFSELLLSEVNTQRIKLFQQTGKYPEQDINTLSIQKLETELNRKEREFINKFAFQSIR